MRDAVSIVQRRPDIEALNTSFEKFLKYLVTCLARQQQQHGPKANGIDMKTYDKTLRQT